MEKNYYDILEVNKNASKEIIEKAYKTLVKKYHPDLQNENLKLEYEEKIKLINEAYEILSDDEKRKNYDLNLESDSISLEDYNKLYDENINLKKEINYLKNNIINKKNINLNNNFENKRENYEENKNNENIDNDIIEKNINNLYQKYTSAVNRAYNDAYIQDLKNRGYKIKYKKTLKDYLKAFISLFITIFIFILIFQIPFVKNYFINLYNENYFINLFINFFINLFN